MLHHWNNEETDTSVKDYVKSVENALMTSLAGWRTVHEDAEFLSKAEFKEKYDL